MSSDRPRFGRARVALVAAIVAALGAAGVGAYALGWIGDDGVDYAFRVPAGTGDLRERGEDPEIFPDGLVVSVGEVIEIVNEDDRAHLVGPFYVGSGETVRQEFTSPGEFEAICTVHPDGEILLTVLP